MAQYLDLTGLTYFKSKLLSSAFQYSYSRTDSDSDNITINSSTNDNLFIGVLTEFNSAGESWESGFTTAQDSAWLLYEKGGATLYSRDNYNSYWTSIVNATPNVLTIGVLDGDSTPYYQKITLQRNSSVIIESNAENMNGDQAYYENNARLRVQTDDSNGVFELKAYTDGYWGGDPEWASNTISIVGDAANGLTINSGNKPVVIGGASANINLGTETNHNFTVTSNNFSTGKTNNEAYIKIGSTTITETQLGQLLALLQAARVGTAQVGTATVI